jgi:hypothetical protein
MNEMKTNAEVLDYLRETLPVFDLHIMATDDGNVLSGVTDEPMSEPLIDRIKQHFGGQQMEYNFRTRPLNEIMKIKSIAENDTSGQCELTSLAVLQEYFSRFETNNYVSHTVYAGDTLELLVRINKTKATALLYDHVNKFFYGPCINPAPVAGLREDFMDGTGNMVTQSDTDLVGRSYGFDIIRGFLLFRKLHSRINWR